MPAEPRKSSNSSQKKHSHKKAPTRSTKSSANAARSRSTRQSGWELVQKFFADYAREDEPILLYGAMDRKEERQKRDDEIIERFRRRLQQK